MWKLVFTKTLENADDAIVESTDYPDILNAQKAWEARVRMLFDMAMGNELLTCKFSIHRGKAVVKIEDTHYCIALVDPNDNNNIEGI